MGKTKKINNSVKKSTKKSISKYTIKTNPQSQVKFIQSEPQTEPQTEILQREFYQTEPFVKYEKETIQTEPLIEYEKEIIQTEPNFEVDNKIIYHEGGDSYRLFLIIPLDNIEWIKDKSLFYLTSGRSNKGFDFMANTFLPTLGLVNDNNLNQYNSSRDEIVKVGHIIKMSDVSKVLKKKIYPTTQNIIIPKEIMSLLKNFVNYLFNDIDINNDNETKDKYYNELFLKIQKIMELYFSNIWQIIISIKLSIKNNSGIWINDDEFIILKEFIQKTYENLYNTIELPSYINELPNYINELEILKQVNNLYNQNNLNEVLQFQLNNNLNVNDVNSMNIYFQIEYFNIPELNKIIMDVRKKRAIQKAIQKGKKKDNTTDYYQLKIDKLQIAGKKIKKTKKEKK